MDTQFESWMRDHGAALRRIIRSYARSTSDQEDLAQDVALAIWRATPSFRGDASVRTFLFRIAHFRGTTFLAKRKIAATEDGADLVPDGSPNPERIAEDRQRVEHLFAALRKIDLPRRQVLTLALEGLSHQEIAECLGTPVENVAVRLSRARAALKAAMEAT